MVNPRTVRVLTISLVCCVGSYGVYRAPGQQKKGETSSLQERLAAGRKIFASTCSGCHGLDGRGGERAPTLAGSARVRRLSDAEVANLISNGSSGTGMPAFRSLSKSDVSTLVRYIRSLEGEGGSRTVSGDPARGGSLFFGRAECSRCHAISGRGGFIGPDLSSYGSRISADAIRDEILSSNRVVPQGYVWAIAFTTDGRSIEGVVRNEDNFSVQLLTLEGVFHFFDRKDLKKLEYSSHSVMPTNYKERLSPGEVDDLVRYLMSLSLQDTRQQTSKTNEDDAE